MQTQTDQNSTKNFQCFPIQCVYWNTWGHILGDGAIYVRDDDFIVPVPQVDGALAAACALVLSGDAECHIIRSILQFQTGLLTWKKHEQSWQKYSGPKGQEFQQCALLHSNLVKSVYKGWQSPLLGQSGKVVKRSRLASRGSSELPVKFRDQIT